MSRNSQFLYAEMLVSALPDATRWLDLGCGHQFVPSWVPAGDIERLAGRMTVIGLDADLGALRQHHDLSLKAAADIERLPLADGTFDLVTANMVLEHVSSPDRLFADVTRVLKPGGRFIVHTPNAHGYTTMLARVVPSRWRPRVAELLQGRRPADVYPTHYQANSLRALRDLASRASLDVVDLRTVTTSAQLFRVPVAGWLEDRWIRLLARDGLGAMRPCIIGVFARPGEAR